MKKYQKNPNLEYPTVKEHKDSLLGEKITEICHAGIATISFWFTLILIILLLFAYVSISGYHFIYWNIDFIYTIPIALFLTLLLAIINITKVFKQRIFIYENGVWCQQQKILYDDLKIKGHYAIIEEKSGKKLRFDVSVSPFKRKHPVLEDLKKQSSYNLS